MTRLSAASLLASISSGMSSTYSVLSNQFSDGLTLENLATTEATTALTSNSVSTSFKSYLQTNFSSVDKDGDGTISSDEITQLTTQMSSQGMTRSQITQLGTTNGYSSETIENILTHFDDIDKDHNGYVTESEIQAFGLECERQNKLTEYLEQKATNMSTFYGSDDSTSDPSSLLDYKYKLVGDNN